MDKTSRKVVYITNQGLKCGKEKERRIVINWLKYSKISYYSPKENKIRRKLNPK